MSVILESDNFNRANETPMAAPWVQIRVATGFNISSNVVVCGLLTQSNEWRLARRNFPADQYVQAAISVTSTTSPSGYGVVARASSVSDDRTMYRLVASKAVANNIVLDRLNAAVSTSLATRTVTWVDGDILRLEITGQGTATLKIFQNGVQLGANVSDVAPLAEGQCGICMASTVTGGSIDNWEAGDFSGAVPERIFPFILR
jgi:hypothetical protein